MTAEERDVLIVDDDPHIRDMLGLVLEEAGNRVRTASDGVEALAPIEEAAPDCMVPDLMMPNLHGHRALRAMREREPGAEPRVRALTCKVHAGEFTQARQ